MRLIALTLAAALLAVPAAAQNPGQAPAANPDWRTPDPENVLVIDTTKGRIIVEMEPLLADAHVERIKVLTRRKFYDGLKFFRVIDEFMAQTGDPRNDGEGDSDLPNVDAQFTFSRTPKTPFVQVLRSGPAVAGFVGATPVQTQPDELMALMAQPRVPALGLFCPGVAGMARAQDPHSANSQFFLMRAEFPRLNGQYTVWGRVISGLDVVQKLKSGEPVEEPMDKMTQVRLLADLPEGQRPTIRVQNTAGPAFKVYADSVIKAKGAAFSICDLEIKSEVR
jgi:peptidylprolyl isomerase